MADAKKCDRCGVFYIPEVNCAGVRVERGLRIDYYDLCANCHTKLKSFLSEQDLKEGRLIIPE